MTPPQRLGHYDIEREIGRGGMGIVYRAHDTRLGRSVALKVLPDGMQHDPDRGPRFEREARLLAALDHECIAAIHGLEEDAGVRFLVLELVEGDTLRDRLGGGALAIAETLAIAAQVASGMAAAHACGVIHRDLKPENIKVTPAGKVKILDFGLARPETPLDSLSVPVSSTKAGDGPDRRSPSFIQSTAPGTILGTVSYMSPEQARGQDVGRATDLWSFGCVLYECLTGRLAFDGPSAADVLAAILGRDPAWERLPPSTPAAVVDLLHRLLEKDGNERLDDFQEAGAVLQMASPAVAPAASLRAPRILRRASLVTSGPPPGAAAPASAVAAAPSTLAAPAAASRHSTTVLRTLLFLDLVDSTRLVETLGDSQASQVFARHDRAARDLMSEHGGQEIDKSDGFFILFERPIDAVRCALGYHAALAAVSAELPVPLAARAGIHLGEVVLRRNDAADIARGARPLEVEGLSKPIGARVMSLAGARQTLLTEAAYLLARRASTSGPLPAPEPASATLHWVHHGGYLLKGVAEPTQIYEVARSGEALLPAPAGTEKVRRSDVAVAAEAVARPESNLPVQLTPFVGRAALVGEARRLLEAGRLVTLTGAGGCGKSRVALEAAAPPSAAWAGGVCHVDLAALADDQAVAAGLATALGVKEAAGRPVLQGLVAALRERELLVVLDNCEHVLPACAALADAVLRGCPRVRLLVTSREALGIAGETTMAVPSLEVPEAGAELDPARLIEVDAVRLFALRAAAARPGFALTAANAAAVVEVCVRLDGIPLALELAAARIKGMPVELLAARLDDAFRLLTGGNRTALPRHQTLRALIDWSHDQLDEPQRGLLRRLAVFSGGWTLEAAEAVCAGGCVDRLDVALLLTQLVEKSLVTFDESGLLPRYRLLGTVRQYAAARLEEAGETQAVRGLHAGRYQELARRAAAGLNGREQADWRRLLDAEHDNLRAALDDYAAEPGNGDNQLRLAAALGSYWDMRGFYTEGRRRLAQAFERDATRQPSPARATALGAAGRMATWQGELAPAQALLEESLAVWRALGDVAGEAKALSDRGILAEYEGEGSTAIALYRQSVALNRTAGERRALAGVLNNLAGALGREGDRPAARQMYEEALAVNRELGNRNWEAANLHNLGMMLYRDGEQARGREMVAAALELNRAAGNLAYQDANLIALGQLELEAARPQAARPYLEEAVAIERRLGLRAELRGTLELLARACEDSGEAGLAGKLRAQAAELPARSTP